MELIQLEDVEILLDKNKINKECDKLVSGSVKIKLNGELDLSRASIALRSMSEVKWMENPVTVYYREGYIYRDYYQDLDIVYNIPDKIRKTVISRGEHIVPFEFKLPDKIPSSISAQHGFISYWIEVLIKGNSFTDDVYRDRKYFTVESPLRENINLSVEGEAEKEIGLPCLGSGKVRIYALIRKKAHIPGETVEVRCLVTNRSTVAVKPRASFHQTQIFMAKERHKTVELSNEPVVGEIVKPDEARMQTLLVHIPTDMPLTIKTRLISIKYFIHVTLDIPHSIDLHLNLPIIISNRFALDDL